VTSFEASIKAVQNEVEMSREHASENTSNIQQLTGEFSVIKERVNSFQPKLTVALSALNTLEKEMFGDSLVIRGLEIDADVNLEQITIQFLADIGISIKPVDVFFLGKPGTSSGRRLIGVKMASKADAFAILKKKKGLKDNTKYKNVFVDSKRSHSYLMCERRLRQFIRVYGKEIEVKRHRDGLLAVKENVVIPVYDFINDCICIEQRTFQLNNMEAIISVENRSGGKTATSDATSKQHSNQIKKAAGTLVKNGSSSKRAESKKRKNASAPSTRSQSTRATKLRRDADAMDTACITSISQELTPAVSLPSK
jgi:hypothetical protein